jgi:hypothetical protein
LVDYNSKSDYLSGDRIGKVTCVASDSQQKGRGQRMIYYVNGGHGCEAEPLLINLANNRKMLQNTESAVIKEMIEAAAKPSS